jgi:hypothetical protein
MITIPRNLVAVCLLSLITFSFGSRTPGDEPLPTTDDAPPARKSSRPGQAGAAGEPKPAPPTDEKILKSLQPGRRIDSEIERMEGAIDGMRRAYRRIEADDTGVETVALQKSVIEDLERLVELLKQQKRNQPNDPQKDQPDDQKQKDRQKAPKPGLDPQNSGQRRERKDQGRGNPSERSDEEKSRDSEERADAAKRALAEEARRQQLIKDVWGHLPPHLREAMRNNFNEKYLPRYEDLIKRYYETLAEQSRKRTLKSPPAGF